MRLDISYRVQNWKQYNQALRSRGDVRIWFRPDVFEAPTKSSRGRPRKFSVGFIELALSLRHLLHLPLRAAQGFVDSLLAIQHIDFRCGLMLSNGET